MSKICYVEHKFNAEGLKTIETANAILEEYAAQGYDLTLRQLYYQFVARGLIPNRDTEYKRLGSTINDARLAGLIDWNHITDRTRNLQQNNHWRTPNDIVAACAKQFQLDKWSDQDNYVEVWVEKDALVGVLDVACRPLDVAFFSCRGYTSQSEMWSAAMRLKSHYQAGQSVHIIHLGDHDPSGIDMTRDITERIEQFLQHHIETADADDRLLNVHRIALNRDQVDQYNPPPNPAKITDSRATVYIAKNGPLSWELDALPPQVLTELITRHVLALCDEKQWNLRIMQENRARMFLALIADNWDHVTDSLDELDN